jgi:hypothetical protein
LAGLHLTEIAARPSVEGGTLDILATVTGEGTTPVAIGQALDRLAAEPGLARVTWGAVDEA